MRDKGAGRSETQRTLFTLYGVPWKWTSKAWRFIPTRIAFCTILSVIFLQNQSIGERLLYGAIFALLVIATQFLHVVGHTLSGLSVGAPMDANLILDTKILTLYEGEQGSLPRRVHLARAIGGPLLNLLVGALAATSWLLTGGIVLGFFGAINLALAVGILLPIPGMDGEVIWRELRRRQEKG